MLSVFLLLPQSNTSFTYGCCSYRTIRYTLGVEAFNASNSVRPKDAPALLESAEEELSAAAELNPKVASYYAARGHLR
jgi:hypothetical protein